MFVPSTLSAPLQTWSSSVNFKVPAEVLTFPVQSMSDTPFKSRPSTEEIRVFNKAKEGSLWEFYLKQDNYFHLLMLSLLRLPQQSPRQSFPKEEIAIIKGPFSISPRSIYAFQREKSVLFLFFLPNSVPGNNSPRLWLTDIDIWGNKPFISNIYYMAGIMLGTENTTINKVNLVQIFKKLTVQRKHQYVNL